MKKIWVFVALFSLCFSFVAEGQQEKDTLKLDWQKNGKRGYFIVATDSTSATHQDSLRLQNKKDASMKDSLRLKKLKASFAKDSGDQIYHCESSEYGRVLLKINKNGTFVLLNNREWYLVDTRKPEINPEVVTQLDKNGKKAVFLSLMFNDVILIDLTELNKKVEGLNKKTKVKKE